MATVIKKETKNKISVDYEGKLSFRDRLEKKLKSSNTWIRAAINVFRFILMMGVSYVILFPFLSKIAGSFMTKEDVVDATVSLIPKHFTLDIYKYLIIENHYLEALLNTTILSLLSAVLQTLVACLIGYGLAKFKFKGNSAIMAAVIVTMVIPHRTLKLSFTNHFTQFDFFSILSLKSMLMQDGVWLEEGINLKGPIELISGDMLNLMDTYWPMVILSVTGLAFKNGLYIYMMRQFFKGVPDELEESAYVDGSGVFRTFFQIILPLSVPMMITIFLFSFSWQWTDNFYTRLFFVDPINKTYLMPDIYKTIPISLQTNYAGKALWESVVKNTAGLLIIAPLVVIYLFCQRYLVQGIERSGLVG